MEKIAEILLILIGPILAIVMKYVPAKAAKKLMPYSPLIDEIQRQLAAKAAEADEANNNQAVS